MSKPLYFADATAFRSWLTTHAESCSELLVGFYKVGSGQPSMTWPESVDEALCFGWIDGVRRRIDDCSYSVRFTPRKPNSIWSKVNIAKFATLEAQGRIRPAGAAAFAKRSEARSAVYSFEQTAVAELSSGELHSLQNDPTAWAYFQATPPSYRKTVLHWIVTAKKAETRAGRLAKLIDACAERRRLK